VQKGKYHGSQLTLEPRRLADETGRTIVIVPHDINHTSASADKIIAMRGGPDQQGSIAGGQRR
jgi:iron complex transport system ATP-binding protein